MAVSSSRSDADGFDHIAQVARPIPEWVRALRLAAVAGRAYFQLARSGGSLARHLPLPERVFPEILPESGLRPGFPAISGDCDLLDAFAAVEGNALQRLRTGLQLRAISHAGDERAYLEALDRNGGFRRRSRFDAVAVVVGDAIGGLHPKSVEDIIDDRYFVEVLDPIGAVMAGNDEAQRKAVEDGKIRAIHRISEQDLAITCMVDVKRLDEIRRLVAHGAIHAVEGDLARARLHAGLLENGFERHSSPARVAHGAVAQLPACDARIEESPAVAGALVDRHDLDCRHLLEVRQRKFRRPIDLALDLEREGGGIDVQGDVSQMIADEEGVVGRDDVCVKDGKRRLELRRPARQADHRALLRIFDKRPITVVERQGCRGCKRPNGGGSYSGTDRRNGSPGMFHEGAPVDHRVSSLSLLAARSASKSGRKFAQQPLPYIPTFVQG